MGAPTTIFPRIGIDLFQVYDLERVLTTSWPVGFGASDQIIIYSYPDILRAKAEGMGQLQPCVLRTVESPLFCKRQHNEKE
jgi:hypothetical protein